MKKCSRCKLEKSRGDFTNSAFSRPGGWCKDCRRTYDKTRHATWNRERHKHSTLEWKRRQREWLISLKAGRPCVDCGGVFHYEAMQWDHLPGADKLYDVSNMFNKARNLILAEIAKCQLVCANCHAIRTFNRRIKDSYPSG